MKLSVATAVAVEPPGGQRAWDLDAYLAECRAADRLGFHAAYTGERRGRGPHSGKTAVTYNPDLLCLYGLDHTERLAFGTQITLLPLHHPVRVVQDACVVNALHPGRYRLGLGAGYTHDDFAAFGVALRERKQRMDAGMEAMRAFLDGTPHEITGPWRGTVPERDPAMGSHPLEILLGGWSEPGVRRAGRFADAWVTATIRTVTAEAELAGIYRAESARHGRPSRVMLTREAAIAGTDEEALARFGAHQLDYARIYFDRGGTYEERYEPWVSTIRDSGEMTMDMVAPDRFLCGSVDTWLAALADWKRVIDPDEVILRLRYFDGPPIDDVLEQMELIGREIIPVVAAW